MTINLNEQLSLGEFFRHMRVGQHVTLKQAAGSWSSSALSRFERGETDISVDRALDVMHNLGMGREDITFWLQTQPEAWPHDLWMAIMCGDSQRIIAMRDRYLGAHVPDAQNNVQQVARIIFKYALADNDARLTPEEEQRVADFTRYCDWSDMRRCLIYAIMPHASHELLQLVLKRNEDIIELAKYNMSAITIITTCLWSALMHNDTVIVDQLAALLEKHAADNSDDFPEILVHLRELQLALDWWRMQRAAAPALQTFFAQVDRMYGQPYSNWMRACVAGWQVANEPWHNPELVDTPREPGLESMNLGHMFAAGEITKRRRQRGLTLEEAAVFWTRSAQLKYEQGVSTMGFSRMLALFNRLAIDESFSGGENSRVDAFGNAFDAVQQMADIEHTFDADRMDAIVAKFRQEAAGMPEWMVNLGADVWRYYPAMYGIFKPGVLTSYSKETVQRVLHDIDRIQVWSGLTGFLATNFVLAVDEMPEAAIRIAERVMFGQNTMKSQRRNEGISHVVAVIMFYKMTVAAKKMQQLLKEQPMVSESIQSGVFRARIDLMLKWAVQPGDAANQEIHDFLQTIQAIGDKEDLVNLVRVFKQYKLPDWVFALADEG